MKRLIAIALVVALVVTAIAASIPAFAAHGGGKGPHCGKQAVFESDFISIPVPGNDEFTGGVVRVRESGDVSVVIRGAPAGRTYEVSIGFADPDGTHVYELLGVMTEHKNGKYSFETTLSSPPFPPVISGPMFVIFDQDRPFPNPPQFTTGFYLTSP